MLKLVNCELRWCGLFAENFNQKLSCQPVQHFELIPRIKHHTELWQWHKKYELHLFRQFSSTILRNKEWQPLSQKSTIQHMYTYWTRGQATVNKLSWFIHRTHNLGLTKRLSLNFFSAEIGSVIQKIIGGNQGTNASLFFPSKMLFWAHSRLPSPPNHEFP